MATTTARKAVDCSTFPSETNCTLYISGTQDEVLKAAVEHAVSTHKHQDTPELRAQLVTMMVDET
jgi:predicted small metal-binding protein